MEMLGPLLSQSLARNIGGAASRSELDKLSEPLKKLVNRYPKAKEWLEGGLSHPTFPSSKVTPEDKSMFVKKLIRYTLYRLRYLGTFTDKRLASGDHGQRIKLCVSFGSLLGDPTLPMPHEWVATKFRPMCVGTESRTGLMVHLWCVFILQD